jgi:tRNA (guanine9-N1)-methyltransferase
MIDTLQPAEGAPPAIRKTEPTGVPMPEAEPEPAEEHKHIVYLTSESPYTLDRLEPNTCYVIGGIVDRNRHKGLCYKRARERGIRTARLPIGQYMVMQSRVVLATNHVVEIMLRWLECGDWGEAFLKVIPKRKGGKLREGDSVSGISQRDGDVFDDEEHAEPEEAFEDGNSHAAEDVDQNATKGESDEETDDEHTNPVKDDLKAANAKY